MGRLISDYIEVVDSSPPQLTLGFPHPRKYERVGSFFMPQVRASVDSASPVTRHTRQSGSTSAPIDS